MKRFIPCTRTLMLIMATFLVVSSASAMKLNHQGMLTDAGGIPVSGNVSIKFTLHDDPTSPTELWAETQSVDVVDGLFSVVLGGTTPIDPSVFSIGGGTGSGMFLGIQVGSDGQISPRTELTAAPFAMHSATVEGFESGPGNVNNGLYSIVGGDNNTNLSDHSTILGGEDNMVDVTELADTVFDTTGASPNLGSFRAGPAHLATTGSILGGHANNVFGNHSVIVQGWQNTISTAYGFVGTGWRNNISGSGPYSVITGGALNRANGFTSVISGGVFNTTTGGADFNSYRGQSIGGGWQNTTDSSFSTISGGQLNGAIGKYSSIGGGQSNRASGEFSTIGGGQNNETNDLATVAGGRFNKSFGEFAFIGGGIDNVAGGYANAIGGGVGNMTSGFSTFVGGGDGNVAGPGEYATVAGGFRNKAMGAHSFAAGTNAHAPDSCSFIWADCCPMGGTGIPMPYTTSAPNTFNVRAVNGFYFLTTCDSSFDPASGVGGGVYVEPGGSMWMTGSSRTLKKNITEVDSEDILARVEQMPVYRWSYKTQGDDVEHMGPMAEDFYATFKLGDNDRAIGSLDPAGVSLAATKALINENNDLKERVAKLERLVEALIDDKK